MRWHLSRIAIGAFGDHGEVAGVSVLTDSCLQIFRHHFDTDYERLAAYIVDGSHEFDDLPNLDGL